MEHAEVREVIAKVNDFHAPYQDNRAINVCIKFLQHLRPNILIIDEVIDFQAISKFNKTPHERLGICGEVKATKDILNKIRKALPDTRIIMLESNHQ
jgi:3-deoxy-D-manno-octulosonic-acid transferase